MPNCLGIYAENNIIKYAKLNTDKSGGSLRLAAYGVSFNENIKTAIEEIIRETNSYEDSIATNIINERYESMQVFSRLNKKDTKELVTNEFANICDSKNMLPSVLEMRYRMSKNTGDPDKYKAICVYTNKTDIANVFQNFSDQKITSISPLGTSIANVLANKGIDDEIAIINIEEETVVTIIEKGEIADIVSFPIGMKDVLPKLAEKYNSYSKAYEACKGVSAYIEDVYALEDSDREILDLIIPMLYELRSTVEKYLKPHMSFLNKIYLTGTGAVINNLDLYFHEVFEEKTCQILVPYFLQKDSNILKEVVEVNTAIALAFNGIGYNDREYEYMGGSSTSLMQSDLFKKKMENLKEKTLDILAANDFLGKKEKKKRASKSKKINIEFNDEVVSSDGEEQPVIAFGDGINDDDIKEPFFTPFEGWLARTAGAVVVSFCLYSGAAYYTQEVINTKMSEVANSKQAVNAWIKEAQADKDKIDREAVTFTTMKTNLEELLNKITTRTISFDIPNFMSKLMFVIPEDVKVTSISVRNGKVSMSAESGQYSQLGYFVSRLKLDKVLKDVDMSVESMTGNIKIKVSGEMP